MRLTLRTLLAYLDDVLEPNAAREIGAKLGESPVAASLVERIKDILKRRRIGTPDVSGPGSKPDPNLVAEYLDNTLIGSDVEDIERICLDSDVHLAEVAACHKILTLVLGEPVEIPRETREQMYALGAAMPSEQPGVKSVTGAQNGSQPRSTLSQPTVLPEEFARPKSRGALLVAALVLVVFGAWIGLVINDHGLLDFGGGDDAADSTLATNQGGPAPLIVGDPDGSDEDAAEGDEVDDDAGTESDLVTDANDAESAEALTDEQINPPPPDDDDLVDSAVVTEIPMTETSDAIDPVPDVVENPAGQVVVVAPGDDTEAPEEPVAPGSSVQILYVSHEDVLLHRLVEPAGWYVLPRNSIVHDDEVIACPAPFEGQLLISGAMCRVDLIGGTRLRFLPPSADSAFQFELERGAVVVRHTGLPDDLPKTFGMHVAGRVMRFELSPGTILGVELDRLPPTGMVADAVPVPRVTMTALVPQGSCTVTDENGSTVEIIPELNGLLTWQSDVGIFLPQVLQSPPAWYSGIGQRTNAARQTARRFVEMFLPDQPIEASLPTVVRHDEQRFAELAVQTLALIGDYPQLVRALDSDKDFAVLAAARELSIWLPLAPDHGTLLRDELLRTERDPNDPAVLETVGIIEELLWGYDEAAAINPEVSQRLVEWLLHPDLAIRLIAFEHIRRMTGITQNYHPTDTLPHREDSVSNWREHLRRNGGALVKPPVLAVPE